MNKIILIIKMLDYYNKMMMIRMMDKQRLLIILDQDHFHMKIIGNVN